IKLHDHYPVEIFCIDSGAIHKLNSSPSTLYYGIPKINLKKIFGMPECLNVFRNNKTALS
ncbi:hypothetical protein MXE31_06375, partial [Acinetobacter baumannii]|nr:hypothetical protein [Acinetobacter baumannii]